MYANRLKKLRVEHGFTMEEVGREIGIKKSSYASYEANYRQPPLDKLKKLSNLYGVTVDYILGLTEERNVEEACRNKFKQLFSKKRMHWDGQEIPEDVLSLIENVLEEALQRNIEQKKKAH